jgi:hypothetical protein
MPLSHKSMSNSLIKNYKKILRKNDGIITFKKLHEIQRKNIQCDRMENLMIAVKAALSFFHHVAFPLPDYDLNRIG